MQFRRLTIESPIWGDNKGKVIAKLTVEGVRVDMTLTLPETASARIIQCCAEELGTAASKQAAEFRDELLAAIETIGKES